MDVFDSGGICRFRMFIRVGFEGHLALRCGRASSCLDCVSNIIRAVDADGMEFPCRVVFSTAGESIFSENAPFGCFESVDGWGRGFFVFSRALAGLALIALQFCRVPSFNVALGW